MPEDREMRHIERDLSNARHAFELCRTVVSNKLAAFEAREGAEDRLINYADEMGVDRAIDTLKTAPELLDIGRAATEREAEAFRQPLTKAQTQGDLVSQYHAEKEDRLQAENPQHQRAVNVGTRSMVYDMRTSKAHWQDTGKVEEIAHDKAHDDVQSEEDEQDQDDDHSQSM
jgi:hypothetical protein